MSFNCLNNVIIVVKGIVIETLNFGYPGNGEKHFELQIFLDLVSQRGLFFYEEEDMKNGDQNHKESESGSEASG